MRTLHVLKAVCCLTLSLIVWVQKGGRNVGERKTRSERSRNGLFLSLQKCEEKKRKCQVTFSFPLRLCIFPPLSSLAVVAKRAVELAKKRIHREKMVLFFSMAGMGTRTRSMIVPKLNDLSRWAAAREGRKIGWAFFSTCRMRFKSLN